MHDYIRCFNVMPCDEWIEQTDKKPITLLCLHSSAIVMYSKKHGQIQYCYCKQNITMSSPSAHRTAMTPQPDTGFCCETTNPPACPFTPLPNFAGTHCAYPRQDEQALITHHTWFAWNRRTSIPVLITHKLAS